jgi:hypothetical protein
MGTVLISNKRTRLDLNGERTWKFDVHSDFFDKQLDSYLLGLVGNHDIY